MAYTTNEKVASVRAQAVNMVRRGYTTREVSRHFGYNQSTVSRWCTAVSNIQGFVQAVETKSSRPHTSPRTISKETLGRIIHTRIKSKRCAEVVYEILKAEGIQVSLSTVKRKLSVYGLLQKRSPWKKVRKYPPRPEATFPGELVQMDTIHFVDQYGKRIYVYTALDVYSRYEYAALVKRIGAKASILFLRKVRKYLPFHIQHIQTDNGPEFGLHFTDYVTRIGMHHRHIHPRSPNENGHLERFNRTIQEEIGKFGWCIFIPKDIASFLKYYNTERMHMGIHFKTPRQMLSK